MSNREPVHTDGAPAAIGPYSQAVVADDTVYTAGQIGLDPASGELVGPDAADQARRALENLRAVLTAAGSSLEGVVKTTVFLADLDDYGAVNDVYGEFFTEPYPARSAVEVSALPKGARVEIEVVACGAGS